MYLEPKTVKTTGGIPVFQRIHETAYGGFSLDVTGLTPGAIIRAGTPMTYNEATRLAKPAAVTPGVDDAPDSSDAKGLLKEEVVIEDSMPLSVVTLGTVFERRIMQADGVTPLVINPAHKAALQGRILFSQSF